MKSKVNLKARINRHSKLMKNNLSDIHPFRGFYYNFNLKVVYFVLIFLVPIYPIFSSYIHSTNTVNLYRGEIDEDSILDSYEMIDESGTDAGLYSKDSFLSVNTLLDEERDFSGVSDIFEYEIKPGESFNSLSYKFNISKDSIYWANDFKKTKILHPGDIIKIPPVSGVVHKVKKGDKIEKIAAKYKAKKEGIIEQNSLTGSLILTPGDVIIIPGGIIEKPKPIKKHIVKVKPKPKKGGRVYYSRSGGKSQYTNEKGMYKLKRRKPQHRFYWGNCTRFVGMYKNVNWGGNAKDWLKNAKAKGHSTGKNPGLGAIVVFYGRGYNRWYGHVGIVIDVKKDHIIVKDMNYRNKLNEITVRKVPKNDRAIRGYIYVN